MTNPDRKPFVIPIFIPHAGCPHHCVFCNQARITGLSAQRPSMAQLEATVTRFLSYRKDADRFTEISFYGGNFLGLPSGNILYLLNFASQYISSGHVHGIRFSTRPDTITDERLNQLDPFPISTVEIGVQSMNDSVLTESRRGHSVRAVRRAVGLIKTRPYRLGLQMMVGLPGDTAATTMATGSRIAALEPDFMRIYPTLVIAGSRLNQWYRQGRYDPMTLEDAVARVKDLYSLFIQRQIKVIRMGLQATDGLDTGTDLIAGPYHPAFGELVYSALWLDAIRRKLQNMNLPSDKLCIELHPKNVSRVNGYQNKNTTALSKEFRPLQITLSTNDELSREVIRLNGQPCPIVEYSSDDDLTTI